MTILGKITPKRIEIKAGMLYRCNKEEFEIKSVNIESRAINIVDSSGGNERQFSPNRFLLFLENGHYKHVGNVTYKKRFLRKPKRIVNFFQKE
jgi:hypothetical protein